MLLGKIAPSFRTILGNSEGPLMELFSQFTQRPDKPGSVPATEKLPRQADGPVFAPRTTATAAASRPSGSSAQPSRSPVDTSEETKP
jgi:hypothetical protein